MDELKLLQRIERKLDYILNSAVRTCKCGKQLEYPEFDLEFTQVNYRCNCGMIYRFTL